MQGDRERCLAAGMDGYVAKPVSGASLARAIAEVCGRPPAPLPEENDLPQPAQLLAETDDAILDAGALLRRLGGKHALLLQVIQLFRVDCAKRMDELTAAAAGFDWPRLSREAHTLKGSLGNLCAGAACAAALRLEMVSRAQSAGELPGAMQALAAEIDRLKPALDRLDRPENT
jgi:HPt (histidine-containing phosphotransfer) domain-containing protein